MTAKDATDDIVIVRDDAARRYEMTVGGERAGIAMFVRTPGRTVFTHTIVQPEFEGRGLGSRLAAFVLDDAVARGDRIVPQCPFIAEYLGRHPEYEESVDRPV
jgi:predicted GNAT family acetyltransferase